MSDVVERIKQEVQSDKIVLFIKGTPEEPLCGFSAHVVEIFRSAGFPFKAVDVIANPDIRATLPQISNWPTFPQIFVKGKLIGGCDIVSEMDERGELKPLLEQAFKEK